MARVSKLVQVAVGYLTNAYRRGLSGAAALAAVRAKMGRAFNLIQRITQDETVKAMDAAQRANLAPSETTMRDILQGEDTGYGTIAVRVDSKEARRRDRSGLGSTVVIEAPFDWTMQQVLDAAREIFDERDSVDPGPGGWNMTVNSPLRYPPQQSQ